MPIICFASSNLKTVTEYVKKLIFSALSESFILSTTSLLVMKYHNVALFFWSYAVMYTEGEIS